MKCLLFFVTSALIVGCACGASLSCTGGATLGAGNTWCPNGASCTNASECSGSCTDIVSGSYWICHEGACVCTDYYGSNNGDNTDTETTTPNGGPTHVAANVYYLIEMTIAANWLCYFPKLF